LAFCILHFFKLPTQRHISSFFVFVGASMQVRICFTILVLLSLFSVALSAAVGAPLKKKVAESPKQQNQPTKPQQPSKAPANPQQPTTKEPKEPPKAHNDTVRRPMQVQRDTVSTCAQPVVVGSNCASASAGSSSGYSVSLQIGSVSGSCNYWDGLAVV